MADENDDEQFDPVSRRSSDQRSNEFSLSLFSAHYYAMTTIRNYIYLLKVSVAALGTNDHSSLQREAMADRKAPVPSAKTCS